MVKYLSSFFLFQIILYTWMILMRYAVPFHVEHFNNFHNKHFETELRDKVPKNFFKNLVIYDAKWYLFLSSRFYETPTSEDFENPPYSRRVLQFAFFPLYPLTLSMFHNISPFQNIETSAFIVSIILQIATSIIMFLFIKRIANEKIALYTSLLLFFAPFSIFFVRITQRFFFFSSLCYFVSLFLTSSILLLLFFLDCLL